MRSFDSPQGPRVIYRGKEVINLCSNNYLGIAGSPELTEAAINAIRDWGVGTSGSRLIGGTTKLHMKLEEEIARFKGEEAALTFNCGYVANISTISSIAQKGMTVYSDSLNHASIIDGCRLSRANVVVFEHGNMGDLEGRIRRSGEGMIITDGIFSMTGEVADLGSLRELSDEYDLLLYVDDAHATGILGEEGRGAADHFNVKADINMGTLSKAVGSQGGFVAGSRKLIDYLTNTARGFIYSTAFPAPMAAAAIKGLELCKERERRERLFDNIKYMKEGLAQLGFDQDISGPQTPIIPIVLGEPNRVLKVSKAMLDRGVFCHPIRYPTVPEDKAMLRITLMATHSKMDLDLALKALNEGLLDHPQVNRMNHPQMSLWVSSSETQESASPSPPPPNGGGPRRGFLRMEAKK